MQLPPTEEEIAQQIQQELARQGLEGISQEQREGLIQRIRQRIAQRGREGITQQRQQRMAQRGREGVTQQRQQRMARQRREGVTQQRQQRMARQRRKRVTQQRDNGTMQPRGDGMTTSELVEQQKMVIDRLEELIDTFIESPRRSFVEGIDEFLVRVVRVVTAGTPVRGPDLNVPRGYGTLIRQRAHVGTPVGYFAGSQGSVTNNVQRSELQDGESVTVFVSNLKNIWVDADSIPAAGFFIELVVTQ